MPGGLYCKSLLAIIRRGVYLMPETHRADSVPDLAVDSASQADTLLIQGLDKYFNGRFEDAIHIWTRVLFLDRTHPRARAYIDRARSAIAERQRKTEEMLQASQQLLDRGDAIAARALFSEAVAAGGDDERAAAIRLKLERVELASAALHGNRLAIGAAPDIVPGWVWHGRTSWLRLAAAAVAVVAVIYVVFVTVRGGELIGTRQGSQTLATPAAAVKMSVPSSSDVAIIRARFLYGRGRLADALQVLDRVDDQSAVRTEADALRVEIQRLLLASGGERR